MGKLVYGLMFMVAIQFALVMIAGQSYTLMSPLFTMVVNIWDWSNLSVINAVLATFVGVTAVVAGLYLVRNEWAFYAALTFTFLTFGATIVSLWNWIASKQLDASIADPSAMAAIATIICAGLSLLFLFLCLDFSSPGRGGTS